MNKNKNVLIGIVISILVVIGGYYAYTMQSEDSRGDTTAYPTEEVATLEKQIKDDPSNSRAYFQLAFEYQALENYDRAIFLYEKYSELSPGDTTPYLNLGNIYTIEQKYDKAEMAYKRVQELNFKELKAYSGLVDIYDYTQNHDSIKKLIADLKVIEADEAFNIGGETAQAIALQARAYKIIKDYDNSIEYYQKMIDLDITPSRDGVNEQIEELKKLRDAQ